MLPDDVDRTRLDPTDDYKTLVLSGLDPPTILDIAARAVSFWQNQSAQEMICQHLSVKDITERNSILEAKLKKAYHEADIEFEAGQKKINGMKAAEHCIYRADKDSELTAELRELRRRYDELTRAYREKDRKLNQTQKLYSTLKQRAQAQNMIPSATLNVSKDVEQTVQSIESARRSDARFLKPELPRQDLRTSTLLKRTPQPMDGTQNSVELLTHQRSGNSVAGSIQAEMSYTRATPGFNLATFGSSGTPLRRETLQTNTGTSIDGRPQPPSTVARASTGPDQHVPGFVRRQSLRGSRESISMQSRTGTLSGARAGRPGTIEPSDVGSKFDQYADKFYHPPKP
ncbi:hypothetical protein H2204_010078 [Knufia peltigerae]|uniref:Uncharacterized protein n=1 Tax=Knufia peltigerae TaxID=1002370 RepID=A0AA38XXP9_9EURO|nr:hypothetical protein H2204_010078 [Knufia peltigerae]